MVICHLCISLFSISSSLKVFIPSLHPFNSPPWPQEMLHINSFSIFIYGELKYKIIDTKCDGFCATKKEAIASFTSNPFICILFCSPLVWVKLLLGVHSVKAFLDFLFPSVATGEPKFSSFRQCVQTSWVKLMTAAAKSLQSCPTLCNPIDGSPPGPGILQARTLEWVAISFSNIWRWKVKVKLLSHVRPSAIPWTAAYQAPPSMGFSRQEYWSGVPLPSRKTYDTEI